MPIPPAFNDRLKVPAIAAPMFLVSGPDLVVETCHAGVIGTFPALNQRTSEGYSEWLTEIQTRLDATPDAAPYGVNLIVHKSNARLETDLQVSKDHKVPLIITSLGAVKEVVDEIHSYGGLVYHDVTNMRHARKAAAAGVDGLIAVCAGAGGHAGRLNPFAMIAEIREFYAGTIILSGAMSSGEHIAAARLMGADLGYLGTRFVATTESMAVQNYKQMILDCDASDIEYTPNISGVHASFLRPSLIAAGLDPDNLAPHGELEMNEEAKVWKTLWSAGHGTGSVHDVPTTAALCARLTDEYRAAMARASVDDFAA